MRYTHVQRTRNSNLLGIQYIFHIFEWIWVDCDYVLNTCRYNLDSFVLRFQFDVRSLQIWIVLLFSFSLKAVKKTFKWILGVIWHLTHDVNWFARVSPIEFIKFLLLPLVGVGFIELNWELPSYSTWCGSKSLNKSHFN